MTKMLKNSFQVSVTTIRIVKLRRPHRIKMSVAKTRKQENANVGLLLFRLKIMFGAKSLKLFCLVFIIVRFRVTIFLRSEDIWLLH